MSIRVEVAEGVVEGVLVGVDGVCKAGGVGGEEAGEGGGVVAFAEVDKVELGVEAFGGEAEGVGRGVGGDLLSEGCVIVGGCWGAPVGIDEVADVKVHVEDGGMDGLVEFDGDGGGESLDFEGEGGAGRGEGGDFFVMVVEVFFLDGCRPSEEALGRDGFGKASS